MIFGDATGDPIADQIRAALRQAGDDGMARSAIYDYFGRNRTRDEIGAALARLATANLATCSRVETGGRPREVWTTRKTRETRKGRAE